MKKKCTKCRSNKNSSEFYVDKSTKDGLRSTCKKCVAEKHRIWLAAHKEEHNVYMRAWNKDNRKSINASSKKYRDSLKLAALMHYSHGDLECSCKSCRVVGQEFLTIDHIAGGGNKHREEINAAGGTKFYQWLKANNYPPGFRVLCWNCNVSLGLFGYCHRKPHK